MKEDLSDLRKNYGKYALRRTELEQNPFMQFKKWFDYALAQKVYEANAMTLATVGQNMMPSLRIVLLKDYGNDGFTFFTNYDSKKGKQLSENPQAAINFFWPELERQIRIEGLIAKVDEAVSEAYFNSRPIHSRRSAMLSPQSKVIDSRDLLQAKMNQVDDQSIKRPDHWGGYKLAPEHFEFWQGGADRFHDRFAYNLKGEHWFIDRIAP